MFSRSPKRIVEVFTRSVRLSQVVADHHGYDVGPMPEYAARQHLAQHAAAGNILSLEISLSRVD